MYMQRTPDVRLRPSSPESDPTLLVPSTLAKDYTCRADTTLSGGDTDAKMLALKYATPK